MSIGSLVRPKKEFIEFVPHFDRTNKDWVGIVTGFDEYGEPIVFWNETFSEEPEYAHQLEVVG